MIELIFHTKGFEDEVVLCPKDKVLEHVYFRMSLGYPVYEYTDSCGLGERADRVEINLHAEAEIMAKRLLAGYHVSLGWRVYADDGGHWLSDLVGVEWIEAKEVPDLPHIIPCANGGPADFTFVGPDAYIDVGDQYVITLEWNGTSLRVVVRDDRARTLSDEHYPF